MSQSYASKETETTVAGLQDYTTTVDKYLEFGNNYLVISTNQNDFNVQITNTAINFRKGEKVLAYMNSEKLFIPESEITNKMRIGNYLWMLPDNNGGAAILYMPRSSS